MSYNPVNVNGSALSSASSPVVIASDQAEVPVKAGTNLNTSALATQATLASILAKIIAAPATEATLATLALEATQLLIKAKTDNIDVLLSTRLKPADTLTAVTAITNVVHVDDNSGSLTVDGTFWQATQPVDTELTTADLDTGAGTDTKAVVGIAIAASGGSLLVGSANPLPVSNASLPLPTGAATESTLGARLSESDFDTKSGSLTETAPASDTASSGLNGRLQRIAQRITSFIALIPASLGQKTKANSLAITIASDQDALPVTGTFWQATQPVSNASLPLPTGASTEATLALIKAKTDNIPAQGQALAAASAPVVLTAAQITTLTPPAAITGFSTETTLALIKAKTDNIDVALSTRTKAADQQHIIVDSSVSVAVTNAGTFAVQATLAAGAAAIAKAEDAASADADVGVPAMAIRKSTPANLSDSALDYEMLQMNAGRLWTSATIDAALPAGSNVIGKVGIDQTTPGTTNLVALAANQSANIAQINGVTPLMGNGASGTGSPRVTVSNDNTPIPIDQTASSSATGACSNSSSTAYETNRVAKASAGRLYYVTGYNSKTAGQFIQLHNTTSLPADTAVPIIMFWVSAQSNFSLDFGNKGRYCSTGITLCNSSTGPTKTVGSADVWIDCQYL